MLRREAVMLKKLREWLFPVQRIALESGPWLGIRPEGSAPERPAVAVVAPEDYEHPRGLPHVPDDWCMNQFIDIPYEHQSNAHDRN